MADQTNRHLEYASRGSNRDAPAPIAKWISLGAAAVEAVAIVFMYLRGLQPGPGDKGLGDAMGFVGVMLPALLIGSISAKIARSSRSWLGWLHLSLAIGGVIVLGFGG